MERGSYQPSLRRSPPDSFTHLLTEPHFDPQIVKKRQTVLAESVDQKILALFSLGMSYADISEHLAEFQRTALQGFGMSEAAGPLFLTEELRARMREERGEEPFFDRGPGYKELHPEGLEHAEVDFL